MRQWELACNKVWDAVFGEKKNKKEKVMNEEEYEYEYQFQFQFQYQFVCSFYDPVPGFRYVALTPGCLHARCAIPLHAWKELRACPSTMVAVTITFTYLRFVLPSPFDYLDTRF